MDVCKWLLSLVLEGYHFRKGLLFGQNKLAFVSE